MLILLLGVALWIAIHLFPAAAHDRRAALIAQVGLLPYKAGFAVALFVSLGLIIWGWGLAGQTPVDVWFPPSFLTHVNSLLMVLAFVVFGAGEGKSNIARYIRHPQLTAAKTWAVAHLLVNGDLRSIILFGGMLAWGVLGVIYANRRDGAFRRPEPRPRMNDAKVVGIGLVGYVAVALAHEWLFGVSPFG